MTCGSTIAVLFGSETGVAAETAECISRAIKKTLRSCSSIHAGTAIPTVNVIINSMDDVIPIRKDESTKILFKDTILPKDVDLVIFVCSTSGNGDHPANMNRFWRMLLSKSLNSESLADNDQSKRLKFAVLGLGDSSYTRYNFPAKKLFRRLVNLGAFPLIPLGLCDDQHYLGVDGGYIPFMETLIPKLLQNYELEEKSSNSSEKTIKLPSLIPIFKSNVLQHAAEIMNTSNLTNEADKLKIVNYINNTFEGASVDELSLSHLNSLSSYLDTGLLSGRGIIEENELVTDISHFQDVHKITISANKDKNLISNFTSKECLSSWDNKLTNSITRNVDFEPGCVLQIKPENDLISVSKFLSFFGLSGVENEPIMVIPNALLTEKLKSLPEINSDSTTTDRLIKWYSDVAFYVANNIIIHFQSDRNECSCIFCGLNLIVNDEAKNLRMLINYPNNMGIPPEIQPDFSITLSTEKKLTLNLLLTLHLDFLGKPRRYSFDEILELLLNFNDGDEDIFIHFVNKLKRFGTFSGQDELYDYAYRPKRNLFDVLVDFNRFPYNKKGECSVIKLFLLDIIPPIKPREYSISDYSNDISGRKNIELLISIDKYETELKKFAESDTSDFFRFGLCSKYIKSLKKDQIIRCRLRPTSLKYIEKSLGTLEQKWNNVATNIPILSVLDNSFNDKQFIKDNYKNIITPTIAISAGTGIAVLKPIIRERRKLINFLKDIDIKDIPLNLIVLVGYRFVDKDFLFEDVIFKNISYKNLLDNNNPDLYQKIPDFSGYLEKKDGILYFPTFSREQPSINGPISGYVQEIIKGKLWWDFAEYFLFDNKEFSGAFKISSNNVEQRKEVRVSYLLKKINLLVCGDSNTHISWNDLLEHALVKDNRFDIAGLSSLILIGGRKSSGMPTHVKAAFEISLKLWFKWTITIFLSNITYFVNQKNIENMESNTKILLNKTVILLFESIIILMKTNNKNILNQQQLLTGSIKDIIYEVNKKSSIMESYHDLKAISSNILSTVNELTDKPNDPLSKLTKSLLSYQIDLSYVQEECWG